MKDTIDVNHVLAECLVSKTAHKISLKDVLIVLLGRTLIWKVLTMQRIAKVVPKASGAQRLAGRKSQIVPIAW